MHSNVTIKNVSWPHFSWATLYISESVGIINYNVVLGCMVLAIADQPLMIADDEFIGAILLQINLSIYKLCIHSVFQPDTVCSSSMEMFLV